MRVMFYYKTEIDAIKHMNKYELQQLKYYYEKCYQKEHLDYFKEMIKTIQFEINYAIA